MKSSDFGIGLDEHVTVAGATGTGKSYAAMLLMRPQKKPFVIFDSKASGTVSKFADRIINCPSNWQKDPKEIGQLLDSIGKGGDAYEKVAFRPVWDASQDEIIELCDKIARWCYLRQNIGLYIDEVSDISRNAQDAPPYVSGIARRGRERHVTLWSTTQRPKGVPMILFTEAAHFFVFRLRLEADRKRIEESCEHAIGPAIASLEKRHFLHVNANTSNVTGPYHF